MYINISKTSKMKITSKRVGSWSIQAGETCPASKDSEVCRGCYAMKGRYRFDSVKNTRIKNLEASKSKEWVDEMVKTVSKYDYFRWFDSGDLATLELTRKIHEVIARTPNVKHWLPTRTHKMKGRVPMLIKIAMLPNVSVRLSADNVGLNNKEADGTNSFVIEKHEVAQAKSAGVFVCPVTKDKSRTSCGECTMCYTHNKVAYIKH